MRGRPVEAILYDPLRVGRNAEQSGGLVSLSFVQLKDIYLSHDLRIRANPLDLDSGSAGRNPPPEFADRTSGHD